MRLWKKYNRLLTVLTAFTCSLAQAETCLHDLNGSREINPFAFVLPDPKSKAFEEMASKVRGQFQANGSFAVLDLSEFIPPEKGEHWFKSMPVAEGTQIRSNGELLTIKDGKAYAEDPGKERSDAIAQLADWETNLIDRAFESAHYPPKIELRISQPNQLNLAFEDWHVDGGTLNATLAIHGMGTEILGPAPDSSEAKNYALRGDDWEKLCPDCRPKTLARAQLVIFLGKHFLKDRPFFGRPTVHRTPRYLGERALFVIRH